jgi:hypothetical protein
MGPKMSVIFFRYSREFVITVIVITEFDCIRFRFDVVLNEYAFKYNVTFGVFAPIECQKEGIFKSSKRFSYFYNKCMLKEAVSKPGKEWCQFLF